MEDNIPAIENFKTVDDLVKIFEEHPFSPPEAKSAERTLVIESGASQEEALHFIEDLLEMMFVSIDQVSLMFPEVDIRSYLKQYLGGVIRSLG